MNKLIAIFGVLAILASTWSYPTGAPDTACDDMTPRHGVDPQTSEIPYVVILSTYQVLASHELELIIAGRNSFKGFLLEFRDGDQSVGKFSIQDGDENAQAIDCQGGVATAATHKNADLKNDVLLTWVAPETPGNLTLYATVVQEGQIFWAKEWMRNLTVI